MMSREVIEKLIRMIENYCDFLIENNESKALIQEASEMLSFLRLYGSFIPREANNE